MGETADIRYHAEALALFAHPPRVSTAAVAVIERWEASFGRRLPAAIREWYFLEGASELLTLGDDVCGAVSLDEFLAGLARGDAVEFYGPRRVNTGYQAFVTLDGSDDPPVSVDRESKPVPFSQYVLELARYKLTKYED